MTAPLFKRPRRKPRPWTDADAALATGGRRGFERWVITRIATRIAGSQYAPTTSRQRASRWLDSHANRREAA